MRFTSTIPPLALLPLFAIAAPNPNDDSAPTSTQISTATKTVTHTQMLATLTATLPPSPSLSYFPLVAATGPVSGPLPDIPNPTSTDINPGGSVVVTQILVALPTSTKSSHKSSSSNSVSAGFPVGTGASAPGTALTSLVIAPSPTAPVTPSAPIASFPGAAPGRTRGCGLWSSGMVLMIVAVGYAAGLL
ncbi:hypothetical protein MMC07_000585 [Pseudocyphellaria aurata]|nr:hypothetical protein [Pseudocyphellaria aurata]